MSENASEALRQAVEQAVASADVSPTGKTVMLATEAWTRIVLLATERKLPATAYDLPDHLGLSSPGGTGE